MLRRADSILDRTAPRSLLAATALLVGASSCISQTPAGTFIGSDPPGALVLLDGKEIGYVTPCNVHLDEGEDHAIRLELPGYAPAEFRLEPARRVEVVPWTDGTIINSSMTFPTFLTWYDFFAPVRTNRALSPNRVFVRLQPTD